MSTLSRPPRREAGVALVTTMIVVAILAVVAVAFMQSSTTDRIGSRISGDYTQAKLAAQAAAAEAEYLVSRLVTRYPDSVTVWQNIGGANSNEATVLYARARQANTNAGARPAEFGPSVVILARPLVSLAAQATNTNIVLFALTNNSVNLSSVLPFANTPTNNTMVNLNATNQWDAGAFVGLRSVTNSNNPIATLQAPITAAQWIYLGAQPGPTNATNPAIARYAFWVEDESFKVNLNVITNGDRGTASLGLSPREIRLDGSLDRSANATNLTKLNIDAIMQGRENLEGSAFPTTLTALVPGNVTNRQTADAFRFLTTTYSAGLDLSRGGFKRFNINSVTNGINGTGDTNNIRTNLNRVIAAITNSNSVPNFGQRFYRLNAAGVNTTNAVTDEHARIYLQKIAANALDYVDGNDQPTIINNDATFTLRTGRPEFGIEPPSGGTEGPNTVAAMGVENVPRLQEYAVHGRIRALNPIGYNSNSPPEDPVANYRISIDHYFEFWNPGTRDITIDNGFLKIYGQPSFGDPGVDITGPLGEEGRDFEVPINGVTFPAGRVTVLTTAPEDEWNIALLRDTNNVVSLEVDDAERIFEGETRATSSGAAFNGNGFNTYFNVSMNPRTTAATDYQSAVLLGTESGIVESFGGLPIAGTGFTQKVPALHFVASSQELFDVVGDEPFPDGQNQYYTRGGSLVGNSHITNASTPSSTEGDPRSLNEQLEFMLYVGDSITSREQTRFFNTISGNNGVYGTSSLGLANTSGDYVRPTNWVDFSSINAGANNAPLFVRNGSLHSIGELGHLTDPARVPGTSGTLTNVVYSRGGGRTLRIGQSEHPRWYDGNQTNASRTWASWRLADIFTTTTTPGGATLDSQGNLTNSRGVVRGRTNANGAVVSIPGLINPNGVLRDNGAAFQAMLHELEYLPSPEGVGLPKLNNVRINGILTAVAGRMTNASAGGLPTGSVNPFWERGEISELPIFNTGSIPATMSNKFDRGREELVRRSIEMITTRGSVFTVYAIGQTLQGTNVTGTARMKQTFEIEPQFAGGAAAFNDRFTPPTSNIPPDFRARFQAPTNFTTRVLATSYD